MLKNKTKNRILKQLESTSFKESRRKIMHCDLGYEPNSQSHKFCLSWLESKESELKDEREAESLSISRSALVTSRSASRRALIAITLSTIMAIYEIIKLYSIKN